MLQRFMLDLNCVRKLARPNSAASDVIHGFNVTLVLVNENVSMVTSQNTVWRMSRTVRKCGIQVQPPAFIIVYRKDKKLRKKVMPLRQFKPTSNIEFVAKEIKERHELQDVPSVKIEKLLRLLQELLSGADKTEAVKKVEKEFEIRADEDLNKLSTHELELQKELMDSLFLKNQIKKSDEGFVYDKQVDFSGEKENSNWDSEPDFWS